MKKYIIYILGVIGAISCENHEEMQQSSTSLLFTTQGVKTHVITRMQNDQWEEDDEIGIFVEDGITGDYIAWNRCFVNEGTTTKDVLFAPKTEVDKIAYPLTSFTWRVYAYYPYQNIPEGDPKVLALDVTDQSNVTDYLYCNSVFVSGIQPGSVDLPFWHCLTKVVLRFFPGEDATLDDLNDLVDVKLVNVNVTANFEIRTRYIDAKTLGDVAIEADPLYNQYDTSEAIGKVAEAHVIAGYPSTTDATKIQFTLNGTPYEFGVDDFLWQFSTIYIYNFVVTANPEGEVKFQSTDVQNWVNGNPGLDLNLDPYI